MAADRADFEQALALALRLSSIDKVRLVERLAFTLEKDMSTNEESITALDPEITWSEQEHHDLMNMKPITPAELVAWLDANPPTERWGNLREDVDAADYVHQMRRNTWSTPQDALPGDNE